MRFIISRRLRVKKLTSPNFSSWRSAKAVSSSKSPDCADQTYSGPMGDAEKATRRNQESFVLMIAFVAYDGRENCAFGSLPAGARFVDCFSMPLLMCRVIRASLRRSDVKAEQLIKSWLIFFAAALIGVTICVRWIDIPVAYALLGTASRFQNWDEALAARSWSRAR